MPGASTPDVQRLRGYTAWLQENESLQGTADFTTVLHATQILADQLRQSTTTPPSHEGAAQTTKGESYGSYLDSVQRGVGNIRAGVGSTLEALGLGDGTKARELQAQRPGVSATQDFLNPGRPGFNWSAADDALVENFPDLAGSASAASLGASLGALGGPLAPFTVPSGALAGAALYRLLRGTGDTAKARAANDGRTEVSAGDIAVGGALSAGTGVLKGIGVKGLGRVLGPAVARGGLRGTTRAALREGATEGAESLVQQAGETAGTKKGLTLDPGQAAGEALLGVGTAGAAGIPTVAKAAVVTPVKASAARIGAATARREARINPDQFRSDIRVGRYIRQEREAIERYGAGNTQQDDVVYKNVLDQLEGAASRIARALHEGEEIDRAGYQVIKRAIGTAKRHNREGSTGKDQHVTSLDEVQRLDIDDDDKEVLGNLLRDINTVSFNAYKKNRQGPLEKITRTGLPKLAISTATHGVTALVPNAVIVAGGKAIDRALGLQRPPHLARLEARAKVAARQGMDPGNPWENLEGTIRAAKHRANASAFVRSSRNHARPDPDSLAGRGAGWIRANGVERGGGWLQHSVDVFNHRLGPHARPVTQADARAAIELLREDNGGYLKREEVDDLLANTGGRMKERAFYDLQDAMAHVLDVRAR